MDRLTFLRREYNTLWAKIAIINKKFKTVSHSGETEYLKLKRLNILKELDSLEQGIKELEAYRSA